MNVKITFYNEVDGKQETGVQKRLMSDPPRIGDVFELKRKNQRGKYQVFEVQKQDIGYGLAESRICLAKVKPISEK
ncbi:hypothetical protein [Enterococcus sp. CSURQ0835]|uniref:hypothetical protein n=1 Tax=Enterococcus sp. CSURQ0835 TaxID=2681394 RepID=UPI00135C39E6|nr:hypothetical protein [Enterococcus sp. CSURQ0835]